MKIQKVGRAERHELERAKKDQERKCWRNKKMRLKRKSNVYRVDKYCCEKSSREKVREIIGKCERKHIKLEEWKDPGRREGEKRVVK